MKKILFLVLSVLILLSLSSCKKNKSSVFPEPEINQYELEIINYFKVVALGFELGNATKVTRKWNSNVKAFIGGEKIPELITELERIKKEINDLATDGFSFELTDDSLQSNYYIYLGNETVYSEMFPHMSDYAATEPGGLFTVSFNSEESIYYSAIWVDIVRTNVIEQKHILREELTQSLGLGNDSPFYIESIFYNSWTTTNEFAAIDKEIIRLLYHPDMKCGLDADQVEEVLIAILKN